MTNHICVSAKTITLVPNALATIIVLINALVVKTVADVFKDIHNDWTISFAYALPAAQDGHVYSMQRYLHLPLINFFSMI